MSNKDVPAKPRRKHAHVPVHKDRTNHKKTFSANFTSNSNKRPTEEQNVQTNIILEIPESDRSGKIKKKHLLKENQRLVDENREIISKFHELEDLSIRKITKLKDKIISLEKLNEEIGRNNDELRVQYKDLVKSHEELEERLEAMRICDNCEKLKLLIEKYSQENEILKNNNKELNSDLDMLKTVIYR